MGRTTILIDTREKKPWEFRHWATQRKGLKHGDYSVKGLEGKIAIERKSLPDLFQSFTKTRKQMVKRLTAMGKLDYPVMIVEASLFDVVNGYSRSSANGRLLFGSVSALCAYHGVGFVLANNREEAELTAVFMIEGFIRLNKLDKGKEDTRFTLRKKRALQG